METNKIVYRKGTFTDFSGIKRPYVFAAATGTVTTEELGIDKVGYPVKFLGIGFSIVHPSDINRTKKKLIKGKEVEVAIYDEQIGEQIAAGKATHYKNNRVMFTEEFGLINTKVVNALLEQEEEHFLSNPKAYIANYERDRIRDNYFKLGGDEVAQKIDAKVKELEVLRKKQDEIHFKSKKHEII